MRSACYVYAIVGRDASLPACSPPEVPELELIPWRELAAVTGRTVDECTPVTVEAVVRHEAIVEAVRREGPALPVRFGTVFRNAESVASALAERYEPLTADLDRLGDKVEMSLTALWSTQPAGDLSANEMPNGAAPERQGAGARYMYARAARLRRDEALKELARSVAEDLDRVVGALALERRVSLLPTPRVAVRTAYLLNPSRVSAFRTAFEAGRVMREELRVMLTGPWPPYSFVRRPG